MRSHNKPKRQVAYRPLSAKKRKNRNMLRMTASFWNAAKYRNMGWLLSYCFDDCTNFIGLDCRKYEK